MALRASSCPPLRHRLGNGLSHVSTEHMGDAGRERLDERGPKRGRMVSHGRLKPVRLHEVDEQGDALRRHAVCVKLEFKYPVPDGSDFAIIPRSINEN